MEIRMDMIETGNTIMECKMMGTVPVTHEVDEFNLYVRTVGSTVIVSRSDTDEKIVSAVGFAKAMTALADHYGLPVIVAHELDHGFAQTKKSRELAGTYEPTREPITSRGLSDGTRVLVGDILVVPAIPGTQPVEVVTFLPHTTIVRHLVTGELEARDRVEYFHGEIVYRAGDVPSIPEASVGDTVYRDRDGLQGIVKAITSDAELIVDFPDGSGMYMTAADFLGEGFEVIPAAEMSLVIRQATGAGSADDEPVPFRTSSKHKNTRVRRARRGGAR